MNDYKSYVEYTIRKYMRPTYTRDPNKAQYTFLSYNAEVNKGFTSQMVRNAIYQLSAGFRSHYRPLKHLHKFRNTECFYDLVYMYCKFGK